MKFKKARKLNNINKKMHWILSLFSCILSVVLFYENVLKWIKTISWSYTDGVLNDALVVNIVQNGWWSMWLEWFYNYSRIDTNKMTAIVQEDNELKKLLGNPVKNAGEDGLMGPPQSVN